MASIVPARACLWISRRGRREPLHGADAQEMPRPPPKNAHFSTTKTFKFLTKRKGPLVTDVSSYFFSFGVNSWSRVGSVWTFPPLPSCIEDKGYPRVHVHVHVHVTPNVVNESYFCKHICGNGSSMACVRSDGLQRRACTVAYWPRAG